jgi:CrcB protein
MTRILLIGAGGFLGSIGRYALSGVVQHLMRSETFPYGTLVVNVLGCFLVGILVHLAESRAAFSADTRAFLIVGILGGFTTFSAFGSETMNLIRDGERWLASANIVASIVFCLAGVLAGRAAAFLIWR